MQNLETVLKYQSVDMRLRRILDEIEKSELSQRMEKARSEFSSAKALVAEAEKRAEALTGFFDQSAEYIGSYEGKIEELIAVLENSDSDEEKAAAAEKLSAIRTKLSELDKKIVERKASAEKTVTAYKEGTERGRKMRDAHNAAKEKLGEVKKEKEPEIKKLTDELTALEKGIAPDVLEVYTALVKDRKYPAFVEVKVDGRNYNCFCGLELSQKNKGELTDKGSCRCETCRRVIYLPEK